MRLLWLLYEEYAAGGQIQTRKISCNNPKELTVNWAKKIAVGVARCSQPFSEDIANRIC